MSRERPLLVPARASEGGAVHLRFDEALVEARTEDTLATALIAAGVLMTSRSPKYRRPRGPYCLTGDCGTCLVRVDGRPNVRACTTVVREGMRVSTQNSYQPRRLDPTAIVDKVFRKGIDHHHFFVRPRIVNQVMQEFARNLTGFGELPDGADERHVDHVDHELPAVVVGCGPAGRAAAEALASVGIEHMVIDRHDRPQLQANLGDARLPARLLASAGAFGLYPGPLSAFEALGEPPDRALLAVSELDGDGAERLHTFRPRHLIFAMGTREPMLPFANNDLPGVVSARGLLQALRRADARLAGRVVVVGDDDAWAETQRAALDALRCDDVPKVERIARSEIERAVGGDRLEAVICKGRRISCALLAIASSPTAAHDLAAQAGVAIAFDGDGFAVSAVDGRCGSLGSTALWAAGDVTGWKGPKAAAADGQAVAARVLQALTEDPEHPEGVRARRFAPVDPPAPPVMREREVVGDSFESDPAEDER